MPIEKRNLSADDITAHGQRHYGSLLTNRNLVTYSQLGRSALPLRSSKNIMFPVWE